MAFVENDDVIEQVSAAVADEAFGNAVLPRAAIAGPLGCDAETLDAADDFVVEVCSSVEDQVLCRRVIGEGFSQLLRDPRARRMPSDAEVQNPPWVMGNDEEAI